MVPMMGDPSSVAGRGDEHDGRGLGLEKLVEFGGFGKIVSSFLVCTVAVHKSNTTGSIKVPSILQIQGSFNSAESILFTQGCAEVLLLFILSVISMNRCTTLMNSSKRTGQGVLCSGCMSADMYSVVLFHHTTSP